LAVDTRDKRASAIHIGLPWRGLLPLPDGTVDQGDRVQAGLFYRALIAEPAAPITGPCFHWLGLHQPGIQKLIESETGFQLLRRYEPGVQRAEKSC